MGVNGQCDDGVGGSCESSGDVRFPDLNSRQRIWGVEVEVDIRPGDASELGGWGELHDPTSGVVWPVTLVLAECFDRVRGSAFLAGKRVLEVSNLVVFRTQLDKRQSRRLQPGRDLGRRTWSSVPGPKGG